jgi:hypothetical protein
MKAEESSNKPKRVRHKHGFTAALKQRYQTDLARIDGRTTLSRRLAAFRASLVADLGGADAVSVQQSVLIDLAVTNKLLLDSLDGWLLQQDSLVNQRRRAVYPIVLQRKTVATVGPPATGRGRAPIATLGDYPSNGRMDSALKK